MSFLDFLKKNQQCLLGYYAMSLATEDVVEVPEAWPPESMTDAALERLQDLLDKCIPVNSIIIDLWDRDIHFERELGDDWYFAVVFGNESVVEPCADELVDFFLEKVDEFGMDYDQQGKSEWFDEFAREESVKFINAWRANLRQQFL